MSTPPTSPASIPPKYPETASPQPPPPAYQAISYLNSVFSGTTFIPPTGTIHTISPFPPSQYTLFLTLLESSANHGRHYGRVCYDYYATSGQSRLEIKMAGLLHDFVLGRVNMLVVDKMIGNLADPVLRALPVTEVFRRIGLRSAGQAMMITADGERCPDQSYTLATKEGNAPPNVVFEVARSQSMEEVFEKLWTMLAAAAGEMRFAWAVKMYGSATEASKKVEVIGLEYPNDPTDFSESEDDEEALEGEDEDEDEDYMDSDEEGDEMRIAFRAVVINDAGQTQPGSFSIPIAHFFHPTDTDLFTSPSLTISHAEIAAIVNEGRDLAEATPSTMEARKRERSRMKALKKKRERRMGKVKKRGRLEPM